MSSCRRGAAALVVLGLAWAVSAQAQPVPASDGADSGAAERVAEAVSPGPGPLLAETGEPAGPPDPDPDEPWGGYRSEIERAWFGAGGTLENRAHRARVRALELGVGNVEAAARALISPGAGNDGLASALLAARVAPDLPIAQMALARVYWKAGQRRMAISQGWQALLAIPRHLEASLWLVGSLLAMFATALVFGSLAFLAVLGASVFSHAAHDLGDLVSSTMPAFARAALLGSLVLLPLVIGQGPLGVALVIFALVFAYGGRHRVVIAFAALLMTVGLYPVTHFAGLALTALDSDPVANAALAVVRGVESPSQVQLLTETAPSDPLAEAALASRARLSGRRSEAYERYAHLLAAWPADAVVLNNLGNLEFQSGDAEAAAALYEQAAGLGHSASVLFNLSQAYARSFRMEEFEVAIQMAQRIDPAAVIELSKIDDADFVADLPLSLASIRERMLANAKPANFAPAFSRAFIGGPFRSAPFFLGGVFAAAVIGLILSRSYQQSSSCSRCGKRICVRCDSTFWSRDVCDACHHLFSSSQSTDPALRMSRLAELGRRESRIQRAGTLVALVLPGAAGILARRPGLGLIGILLCVWAVAAIAWRNGFVPDPLAMGAASSVVLLLTAAMATLGYVVSVLVGLMIRRSL